MPVGDRYMVNELFRTFQGEGVHTGRAAQFIRLQGCPVGCAWCDTKYTWPGAGNPAVSQCNVEDLAFTPTDDAPRAAWLSTEALVGLARGVEHVVLTGGEPAVWPLMSLCEALLADGHSVQVETSGTQPLRVPAGVFVTVSPKLDMPGGYPVLREVIARANEIKYPVGKSADLAKLRQRVLPHADPHVPVYLQPLSQSRQATRVCIEACAAMPSWRISIQTHKYAGVQ